MLCAHERIVSTSCNFGGYVLARISHENHHHRTGSPKNSSLALPDRIFGMERAMFGLINQPVSRATLVTARRLCVAP